MAPETAAVMQELRPSGDGVSLPDFPDQLALTPESAGLRAISNGFPLIASDDEETLARATFLCDALYAALRERLGREAKEQT